MIQIQTPFSETILSETGPPSLGESRPKNDIRNGRLKCHRFRVYNTCKPVLRSERWYSGVFFGFRNGVVSDGLNAAIKRSMFGILSGTWCDLRVKPVKAPPKRGRTYIGVMWGIRFKSPSEKAILLLSKVGYHVQ